MWTGESLLILESSRNKPIPYSGREFGDACVSTLFHTLHNKREAFKKLKASLLTQNKIQIVIIVFEYSICIMWLIQTTYVLCEIKPDQGIFWFVWFFYAIPNTTLQRSPQYALPQLCGLLQRCQNYGMTLSNIACDSG